MGEGGAEPLTGPQRAASKQAAQAALLCSVSHGGHGQTIRPPFPSFAVLLPRALLAAAPIHEGCRPCCRGWSSGAWPAGRPGPCQSAFPSGTQEEGLAFWWKVCWQVLCQPSLSISTIGVSCYVCEDPWPAPLQAAAPGGDLPASPSGFLLKNFQGVSTTFGEPGGTGPVTWDVCPPPHSGPGSSPLPWGSSQRGRWFGPVCGPHCPTPGPLLVQLPPPGRLPSPLFTMPTSQTLFCAQRPP